MKHLVVFLLLCLALPLSAQNRVMGYYPSWTGLDPASIGYQNFTHIYHSFLNADTNGNLIKQENLPSRKLTTLARKNRVFAILSLGGAGSGKNFTAMMKNPGAAKRYVSQVTAMVKDYGYHGIDLDWEHPVTAVDRDNLTLLFKSFRQSLGPDAIISMAVASGDWTGKWIDAAAMLPLVDFINVMSYDMHGPWSAHAGHLAPLNPIRSDKADGRDLHAKAFMDYWEKKKGWPKEKLNFGIPCYGYGYTVSRWHTKPGPKSKFADGVAYRDIPAMLKNGWTRLWESGGKVPYLKNKKGTELISYEDPESASLKGAWAKENNYGGIFFWEISQDYMNEDHAIVRAARAAYLSK